MRTKFLALACLSAAAVALGTAAPAAAALSWAPCGAFDDNGKVVEVYDRYRTNTPTGQYMAGGFSDLDCGSSNYGYRHIVDRHLSQWEAKAALTKQNWREVADFGINWALQDPDRTTYRSYNDTFCFQRLIYLVNTQTGQTAGTTQVAVVVARVSKNIITAFPGSC